MSTSVILCQVSWQDYMSDMYGLSQWMISGQMYYVLPLKSLPTQSSYQMKNIFSNLLSVGSLSLSLCFSPSLSLACGECSCMPTFGSTVVLVFTHNSWLLVSLVFSLNYDAVIFSFFFWSYESAMFIYFHFKALQVLGSVIFSFQYWRPTHGGNLQRLCMF